MEKIPVTVEILTHDSGNTLRRALTGLRDFAEVLIVDGASTDDTHLIASEYGVRIVPQDARYLEADGRIRDFAGIRNQGLAAATQPWFLFLDSDEYVSPELVEAIRAATMQDPAAYRINRTYVIAGKVIDCATTYPNVSMRFFHTSVVQAFTKAIHERIELKPGAPVRKIEASIYVPFDIGLDDLRRKWDYYIGLEVARSRPVSLAHIVWTAWSSGKASLLYAIRLARNYLLCRGARMPLAFELERHRYHARLLTALWRSRNAS